MPINFNINVNIQKAHTHTLTVPIRHSGFLTTNNRNYLLDRIGMRKKYSV